MTDEALCLQNLLQQNDKTPSYEDTRMSICKQKLDNKSEKGSNHGLTIKINWNINQNCH